MTESTPCRFPHNAGPTGYSKGCRCPRCVAAKSVIRKRTYIKNAERYRKYGQEYRHKNRELYAALRRGVIPKAKSALRRRANKSRVPIPSCPEQYKDLLKVYIQAQILIRDGIPCHVDHIIPLEHGGTHTANNVRLLDPKTNMTRRYAPDTICVPLQLTTPNQLQEYTELIKKFFK